MKETGKYALDMCDYFHEEEKSLPQGVVDIRFPRDPSKRGIAAAHHLDRFFGDRDLEYLALALYQCVTARPALDGAHQELRGHLYEMERAMKAYLREERACDLLHAVDHARRILQG
ncbi:MAG: hypothetical protein HY520_02890 [Candidatus Aenigmarchaeota archaeon]|nr:hypothetical protein [Candidatus Aenigmarchaeota archaeon]